MTGLEIACVVIGLIGMISYVPTRIKVENGNFADIMFIAFLIVLRMSFLAMVLLPLYFRFWK